MDRNLISYGQKSNFFINTNLIPYGGLSALINESQPLQSPNSAESKNRQKCQKLIRGARAWSSAPLQCISAEIITFSSQINFKLLFSSSHKRHYRCIQNTQSLYLCFQRLKCQTQNTNHNRRQCQKKHFFDNQKCQSLIRVGDLDHSDIEGGFGLLCNRQGQFP